MRFNGYGGDGGAAQKFASALGELASITPAWCSVRFLMTRPFLSNWSTAVSLRLVE